MKTLIKYNINVMFSRKTFWISFFGMLIICIGLPFVIAKKYVGQYEYALPSAENVYVATNASWWWESFALILPFLILLPYVYSFMNEYKSGVIMYIQARNNRRHYYYAQMLTCFVGTCIIIIVPFLINILMNSIIFPNTGSDEALGSQYGRYMQSWSDHLLGKGYYRSTLCKELILCHIHIDYPVLYNIIFAIMAGMILGVIAMFFYGISLVVKKGSVWVLLISYLTFQIFEVLDRIWEDRQLFGVYVDLNVFDYLCAGLPIYGRVYLIMAFILLAMLVASCGIINYRAKHDEV